MPDRQLVAFVSGSVRPPRIAHIVQYQPSEFWVGATWCGRFGEPAEGELDLSKLPVCRSCERALERDAVERGLAQIEAGEGLSPDEVRERLGRPRKGGDR